MTPTTSTTATGAAEGSIFKTDTMGRVRVPAARREALLDEFERGGASGQAFAAMVGVRYSTFATWMQDRRRAARARATGASAPEASAPTPSSAGAVRWLEALVAAPPAAAGRPQAVAAPLAVTCPVAPAWRSATPTRRPWSPRCCGPWRRTADTRHPTMLSFASSLRVFVALEPCDLRKSFEGLAALVTGTLAKEVKSGALFVFGNRARA